MGWDYPAHEPYAALAPDVEHPSRPPTLVVARVPAVRARLGAYGCKLLMWHRAKYGWRVTAVPVVLYM